MARGKAGRRALVGKRADGHDVPNRTGTAFPDDAPGRSTSYPASPFGKIQMFAGSWPPFERANHPFAYPCVILQFATEELLAMSS